MAVAHVATYGVPGSGNKSAGTNLDVTGVAYNTGDHLYAFVVCDDSLAADSILSTSVSGGTGLTWSRVANSQAQSAASSVAMSIFRGVAASSQTGQTITFAPLSTVAAKIMLIERFSGADASTRGSVSANGVNATPSVTASGAQQPQSGDLLLGMLGVESTFDYTYTDDADTTNGTWVGDVTAGTSGGASTTNVRVHAQYKIVTANGDQTFDPGLSAAKDWRALIVSVVAAAAGTDLVVADCAHGHTSDAVVLTQDHNLAVADSDHAHAAENVVLTQDHILVVADSDHGHTVENVALTQVHNLTVADSDHAHTVESPTLTQLHLLAVADSDHAHTADSPTLTQDHTLAGVADLDHAHTVDNVVLTAGSINLVVDDCFHGHTTEAVVLTQTHNLAIDDASHTHAAESPTLTQTHNLAVADSDHGHTVDNVALTQAHNLAVDDSAHSHAVESLTLGVIIDLVVADMAHSHVIDAVTITQAHNLLVDDAVHEHFIDAVGDLEQTYNLIVADMLHTHTIDEVPFNLRDITILFSAPERTARSQAPQRTPRTLSTVRINEE